MKILVFLVSLLFTFPLFAQLSISPLSSGQVDLDSANSQFIYLSNSGSSPISMNLSLSEVGYKIALDRCSGKTLAKNKSCYILVETNLKQLTQINNLASLKNNNIHLVNLKRTKVVIAESVMFLQTSLIANDFLTHDVSVKNNSSSSKSFTFSLSGTDALRYSILVNRCVNIPAQGTCSVSLKLKPQQAGSYSAILSDALINNSVLISSTITGSTSGVISNPVESLALSTSFLNFGTLRSFGVSQALSFSIQNTGNILFMPIISSSPKMTIVLNRCLILLAPGKSCSVSVAMNLPYPEENNDILGQFISVKPSALATLQYVNVSGSLSVPPAIMLNSGLGGICPSNQHFEGAICSSNERVCSALPPRQVNGAEIWSSGSWSSCQARSQSDCDLSSLYAASTNSCDEGSSSYPRNCDKIKSDNPSAVSDYYELSLNGVTHQSVYCDFSDSVPYMEIFNLDRQPLLTDSDILNKLNAFTNNSISLSNIYRDPNSSGVALVAQYNSNTPFSYALNKAPMSGMSITFYKSNAETNSAEGGMAIFDHDPSSCSPDTSNVSNCFNSVYKFDGNSIFSAFDQTTGMYNPNWYLSKFSEPYPMTFEVSNHLIDRTPLYSYLATFGRDGNSNGGRTLFYIKSLKIKSRVDINPISCADAKSKLVLNSENNSGSGIYTVDFDGHNSGESPTQVFCDMSGAGQITVSKSCFISKQYGQKSLNNDLLSGLYSIDIDGLGSGADPVNTYCDMVGGSWDGYAGGYTLVGAFNNSALSTVSSIDISSSNVYLNNSLYQTLLSQSSNIVLRSNRQDNTEVIFKIAVPDIPLGNCHNPTSTAAPAMPFGTTFYGWGWRESAGCNFSGADYTSVGIRSDVGDYFFAYGLSSGVYIKYYNWLVSQFEIVPSIYSVDKNPSESIYFFLK